MRRIKTPEAPAAVGAYAQGVVSGDLFYTSGQIALTKDGELVSGGIEAQTHQIMDNLQALLGAVGCRLADVVKTQIYLTSSDDFPIVNCIYGERFEPGKAPARDCVVVAAIPFKTPTDRALLEMSMIAELQNT